MTAYITTTLFGQKYAVEFDACFGENHGVQVQVTDHPIDKGASISDHLRAMPRRVSIDVVVTNTPIVPPTRGDGTPAPLDAAGGGAKSAVTTSVTRTMKTVRWQSRKEILGGFGPTTTQTAVVAADVVGGDTDRVFETWQFLSSMAEGGAKCEVYSELATYSNMVISSLTAPVSIRGAQVFSIEFVEVRRASSTVVEITRPKERRKQAKKSKAAAPVISDGLDSEPVFTKSDLKKLLGDLGG